MAAAACSALGLCAPPAAAATHAWTDGSFVTGVTAPQPMPLGDVLQVGAGLGKQFNAVAFTNLGAVRWQANGGELPLANGSIVTNFGLWDAQGDQALSFGGGVLTTFNNAAAGTFRKSAGSGSTQIGTSSLFRFVNSGLIEAQTGTIAINGTSSFLAGSQFSGAGVVQVNGPSTFTGALQSSNLVLAAGLQTGSSAVINGTVSLGNANVGGSWSVAAGGTLAVQGSGGGPVFFSGASLVNQGTVFMQGNAMQFATGASVDNQALFEVRGDLPLFNQSTSTFTNQAGATLRKSTGNGVAGVGDNAALSLVNRGTIESASGTLRIQAAGNFQDGTVFTGAGRVEVASSASYSGNIQSGNLSIVGGTHTGNAALLAGTAGWSAGTLGGSWTVASGATLNLQAGGAKALAASTSLDNRGSLVMQAGAGDLLLALGGTINNHGVFDIQGDSGLQAGGGANSVFTNQAGATLRKSGGSGASVVGGGSAGVNLVNHGTIDVAQGTLRLSGGNSFNSGTVFAGSGRAMVDGSSTFSGAIQSSNLNLAGGIQTGSAAVLGGNVAWSGGTLVGGWQVSGGSTLALQGLAGHALGNVNLVNSGTVAWQNGNLTTNGAGSITNHGSWQVQGDLSLPGGTGFTFTNHGVLSKTAGAGVSQLGDAAGLSFVNHGTLQAASGTLRLAGSNTFNHGSVYSGAGVVEVTGSSSFVGTQQSSNLRLAGGSQTGQQALLQGAAGWTQASLRGQWTVAPGATLALQGAGSKLLLDAAVLSNQGSVTMAAGSADLQFASGDVTNLGTWTFEGDSGLNSGGGAGLQRFTNLGTLRKTGGSGTSSLSNVSTLQFINSGLVDVQVGTIALPTGFVNAGTLMGDGRFSTPGGLSNQGTVAPGSSGVGSLDLAGNFAQTAAGLLSLDIGSAASFDQLLIDGTAALGGTLELVCAGACNLAAGTLLTILDSTGARTGSFAGNIVLQGFASGAFELVYGASDVQLLVTQGVTAAVPEPATWAALLAGLVAVGGTVRRRASRPPAPGATPRHEKKAGKAGLHDPD